MRTISHQALGEYLARQYLPHLSPAQRTAFLFGCREPDRNPTTYLKGSRQFQWLRGHNYHNAQRCMSRWMDHLERSQGSGLWHCYRLGKLIHYITDAFTYAHNRSFPGTLRDHVDYEHRLHEVFLPRLAAWDPECQGSAHGRLSAWLTIEHLRYDQADQGFDNDIQFVMLATTAAMRRLAPELTLPLFPTPAEA